MNWLLVVALIIIGACAFAGWRAGFVKTVFSLVSTIAVIILTLIFSPVVSNMLKNNETVFGTVKEKIGAVVDLSGEEGDTESFIDGLSLPDSIKNMLKNNDDVSGFATNQMESLEDYICELLAGVVINAIGFIVTFLIAAAGMALLCFLLDVISKLPVLHQINTIAGIAVGALEGLVILWILFIVVTMLGSTEFGQTMLGLISESKILSFLYDCNFLSKIVIGK